MSSWWSLDLVPDLKINRQLGIKPISPPAWTITNRLHLDVVDRLVTDIVCPTVGTAWMRLKIIIHVKQDTLQLEIKFNKKLHWKWKGRYTYDETRLRNWKSLWNFSWSVRPLPRGRKWLFEPYSNIRRILDPSLDHRIKTLEYGVSFAKWRLPRLSAGKVLVAVFWGYRLSSCRLLLWDFNKDQNGG